MFKWIDGRNSGGYKKLPLIISELLKFDCYLLKFEPGSMVHEHLDPVPYGRHYRMNIILKKCTKGGMFVFNQKTIYENRFFHIFRPDIVSHSMSPVYEGTTYVLSIGKLMGSTPERTGTWL